jgi:transcriptional regulator with XRE-family HTH domain
MIRHIPKILEFLGFNPESEPEKDSARIVHLRRQLGLTQKQLARVLAVDPVTLYRWENSITAPPAPTVHQIAELLPAKPQLTRQ